MVKWLLISLFALLLSGALAWFVVYPFWARRLIYPADAKATRYPGEGVVAFELEERLLVEPEVGAPFFAPLGEFDLYSQLSTYKVALIEAHQHVAYAVGRFVAWEKIPGSVEKYLLVRYPKTLKTDKFRVTFGGDAPLFELNPTSLWVEGVGFRRPGGINPVTRLEMSMAQKIIKTGDAVVILPVYDVNELAKKDANGYYLARVIQVRRVKDKL